MVRARLTAIVCLGVLLALLSPLRQSEAAEVPTLSPPTQLALSPVASGVQATWKAPANTSGMTGYRVWTNEGFDRTVPADRTKALVEVSAPGKQVTVNVSAVHGAEESPPVSAKASGLRPGGLMAMTSSPATLLDSTRGIGGPTGKVKGGSVRKVQVTGRGGVPSTGVRSALLSLRISAGTAKTNLRGGPAGGTRSDVVTVAAGQPRVRTMLVPVSSSGQVAVVHSTGAAHLRVDVVGFTTTVTGSSSAAGRVSSGLHSAVASGKAVAPGAVSSISVLGRGGVPSTGVAAVLMRVRAKAGRATAVLGFGPSSTAARSAALMTPMGTRDTVLAGARVGTDGKVRVRNLGKASTTVTVEVTDWIAAPTADAGRWLQERGAVVLADSGSGVGTTKGALAGGASRTVQVAGRAGVPPMLGESPPRAVILRLRGRPTSTAATSLSVRSGSSAFGLPVLETSGGRPTSAVAAVNLSGAGAITLRNDLSGSSHVIVEVLGWSVDRPTLAPGGRVLTAAEASKFSALDGDVLTVKGLTRAPSPGEVLASGPTDTNPFGFLRRVTGVDVLGDGTSRLTTEPARIGDILRSGEGAVSQPIGTPVETLVASDDDVSDTFGVASPLRLRRLDKEVGIHKTYHRTITKEDAQGNSVTLTLDGSASVEAEAEIEVEVGWRGVDARVSASAEEALDAKVAVSGAMTEHAYVKLGRYKFRTFVFQVGPVPVVVTPVVEADVRASFSANVEADVTFHQASSGEIGVKSHNGSFEPIKEFSNEKPTLTPAIREANFGGEVELTGGVDLEFYGDVGSAGVGLSAGITTNYSYPDCFIQSDAYLDANLDLEAEVPVFDDLDYSDSFRIHEWDLPEIRVPGAAGCPWTGVIEISSGWSGSAKYRPPDPKENLDNARSGATGLTLRRVVPDGDTNGYWVNSGSIKGSVFPGCYSSSSQPLTKYWTGTVTPEPPPPPEDRGQWRLTTDSPPDAFPGTGSAQCGDESTGYPVDLQVDTGAYLALADAWGQRPTSDDTVDRSWTYNFGSGCILDQGVSHWCHGAAYTDFATYQDQGAVTITVRMTRLKDVDSNGIPD